MKLEPSWMWKIYFLLYLLLTSITMTNFFSTGSQIHRYYHILIGYHIFFLIPYFLNVCSIFLNILACIGFYFFLYKTFVLSKKFWKIIFYLRLVTDLLGRSYEVQFLTTLYFDDIYIFYILIITILLIYIPSYLALYQYSSIQKFCSTEAREKSS